MHAWVALGVILCEFYIRALGAWMISRVNQNWIGLSLMRTGRSYTDIILWIIYFMWFFLKLCGLAWFVHKCLAWVNIQKLCTVGQCDLVNSTEAKQSSLSNDTTTNSCTNLFCTNWRDINSLVEWKYKLIKTNHVGQVIFNSTNFIIPH